MSESFHPRCKSVGTTDSNLTSSGDSSVTSSYSSLRSSAHSRVCPSSPGGRADSVLAFFPAAMFRDYDFFESRVLSAVHETRPTSDTDILFNDIQPLWGRKIVNILNQKSDAGTIPPVRITFNQAKRTIRIRAMPTWIHNCLTGWVISAQHYWNKRGYITDPEYDALGSEVGTNLIMNCPPYQDCTKQPDFFFVVGDSTEATVAFEAGWSESLPRLRQDMDLLLRGSGGSINPVVVINWTKRPGNYVAGVVQVYVLDQFGSTQLEQEQTIFPRPPDSIAQTQQIEISRAHLFGSALQGNGADMLHLSLEDLRQRAELALNRMGGGCQPAV